MDDKKMDYTEWLFSGSIALVFPFFFKKLLDYVNDDEKVNKMCDKYNKSFTYGMLPSEKTSPEEYKLQQACWNKRAKLQDTINFKKHIFLLIIGLVAVIASGLIKTKSTKMGLGLGGLLSLLYAISTHWYHYNDRTRLAILGISLIIFFVLSIRLYQIKDITDIFTFEYGTK